MRKLQVICDHCGKEVAGDYTIRIVPQFSEVTSGDIMDPDKQLWNQQWEKDYCEDCAKAVIGMLTTAIKAPATKTGKKSGRKPKAAVIEK